jgi:hypothetical protein
VAALVDHLWQSSLLCLVVAMCVGVSRDVDPRVRLWMWRIAALKFALPFALLVSFGEWWGMPPTHSADPPPMGIVALTQALLPWVSPAQAHGVAGARAWLALATLVPALVLCAWFCRRGLAAESRRARETMQPALAGDPATAGRADVAGVGFLRAMLFTALPLCLVSAPVLAGAAHERVERRDLLLRNALAFKDAPVLIQEAKPGMGYRLSVVAGDDSVLIRNANLQDLVAMVYGVNSWIVTTNQFQETQLGAAWIYSPRYDLRVVGHVAEPGRFDTYALRVPVTRLLSTRFGLEIYVNSKCQPPCGRWGMPAP